MRPVSSLPIPALLFGIASLMALSAGAVSSTAKVAVASTQDSDGFESLIRQNEQGYVADGWEQQGPGYFLLDPETGVLESHGGMGLFYFGARQFSDFVLELEYKTSKFDSNSGIFVRIPEVSTNNDYIAHSFEIQIDDADNSKGGKHVTGSVFDVKAPTGRPANKTGEWNHFRISFVGEHITVELNGEQVLDWDARPGGKVKDFAAGGYIGLQNHDRDSSVWFRNIRIKDVAPAS